MNQILIENLRNYDLSKDIDKYLENDIRDLIKINSEFLSFEFLDAGDIIRATNHFKEMDQEKDHWSLYRFPPNKYVNKFQRANIPYNSMFYGIEVKDQEYSFISESASTFEACNIIRNDSSSNDINQVTISKWGIKQKLKLIPIVNTNNEFMTFIYKEFRKKVQNDHEYKICSYFTKIILELNKDCDGIKYKSVQANSHNRNCIALKKESVDKLQLYYTQTYNLSKHVGKFEYELIEQKVCLPPDNILSVINHDSK